MPVLGLGLAAVVVPKAFGHYVNPDPLPIQAANSTSSAPPAMGSSEDTALRTSVRTAVSSVGPSINVDPYARGKAYHVAGFFNDLTLLENPDDAGGYLLLPDGATFGGCQFVQGHMRPRGIWRICGDEKVLVW